MALSPSESAALFLRNLAGVWLRFDGPRLGRLIRSAPDRAYFECDRGVFVWMHNARKPNGKPLMVIRAMGARNHQPPTEHDGWFVETAHHETRSRFALTCIQWDRVEEGQRGDEPTTVAEFDFDGWGKLGLAVIAHGLAWLWQRKSLALPPIGSLKSRRRKLKTNQLAVAASLERRGIELGNIEDILGEVET